MFQKKTSRGVATISLIAVAAAVFPYAPAHAQDGANTVQNLDQRIRILERKLELEKEAADTKAKDATTASASDKGFSLKKGDFEFKFNALVQLDGRWFLDDARNNSANTVPALQAPSGFANLNTATVRNAETFVFRRIRPTFQGSIGKLVGYRLTPEFAGTGATIIDAYIDLKFDPAATVRVGKVKGPVGLERLQGGGATHFIERGLPTELVPNREIGVQLQGEFLEKTLSYTVGVYNGTQDGANTPDASNGDGNGLSEVAARIFYEPVKGIGFGIAGSRGSKEGGTPRNYGAQPDALNSGIQYTANTVYDGAATRIAPQGYAYFGSVGFLGEYTISKQQLRNGAAGGANTFHDEISNEAWQLVSSFVLTGEDASFSGVKPKQPFEIGKPGWGAVELVARYGELEVDGQTNPAAATVPAFFVNGSTEAIQSYGVGANWWVNNNVRLALNYNKISFDTFNNAFNLDDRESVFARVQLQF